MRHFFQLMSNSNNVIEEGAQVSFAPIEVGGIKINCDKNGKLQVTKNGIPTTIKEIQAENPNISVGSNNIYKASGKVEKRNNLFSSVRMSRIIEAKRLLDISYPESSALQHQDIRNFRDQVLKSFDTMQAVGVSNGDLVELDNFISKLNEICTNRCLI